MIVKLLTEHNLEFVGLKGCCRGSSESTLVKISNCWKSHAAAQIFCFALSCCSIVINRRQSPPIHCIKIQHGHTHCHAYGSARVTTSSMHQNTTWSHSLSRVRIGDSYHQSNASKYNMVTLTVTRTDRLELPPVQCIKIQHGHTHCHAYGSATVTTSPMHQNTTWSHSLSRVRIGDRSPLLPPVQHIIVYQDYTDIDSQFIFATTH